jgi:hypothetical protein
MQGQLLRLFLTGFAAVLVTAAQAQLLTKGDISYSVAKTIAETAIESCTTKGYRVSAVVVNRARREGVSGRSRHVPSAVGVLART